VKAPRYTYYIPISCLFLTMSKRSGPLAPGVAFITGGARGLGNAVAVSFAKEGARGVVLVDVQDEATFAQGKKNVEAYGTEVTIPSSPPSIQIQALILIIYTTVSHHPRRRHLRTRHAARSFPRR
jgi:NAD(P)-dependent dehydrogenase (short-subunit alcohol dehydrogenase family)